jgi:hypothetical protein
VSSYNLLLGVPAVLNLVTLVIGFIVLATRRRQTGQRPSMLAMIGLGLLLANAVFVFAAPFAITFSYRTMSDFAVFYTGLQLISGLVHMAGILLLVFAVVAERQPGQPPLPWQNSPIVPVTPEP